MFRVCNIPNHIMHKIQLATMGTLVQISLVQWCYLRKQIVPLEICMASNKCEGLGTRLVYGLARLL